MTRKKYFERYGRFMQKAFRLACKAKEQGIPSLENECEDLDDELFKTGLRLIIDEAPAAAVDEIMSARISHEKDKYEKRLKAMQKRAVLGILAGESVRILYMTLNAYAGLTRAEEREIDLLVMDD